MLPFRFTVTEMNSNCICTENAWQTSGDDHIFLFLVFLFFESLALENRYENRYMVLLI